METVDLEPGQVWSYRTRPGEDESRLTVLGVETVEGIGEVVHVASDVLRASLDAHIGDVDGPLDLSGIAYWREATGGTSGQRALIGRADLLGDR